MIADMESMTLTLSLMTIARRARFSLLHGKLFHMPRAVLYVEEQSLDSF
jgi:hypothetical protein